MRTLSLAAILTACWTWALSAQKEAELADIAKRLQSVSLLVRERAMDELEKLARKRRDAIPLLAAALSHPDADLRLRAAKALNDVDAFEPAVVRALARTLQDTNDDSPRQWALLALLKAGKAAAAAAPVLIDALYDDDRAIAELAWKTLSAAGHDPRPALRKRLELPDHAIQLASAEILIHFDNDKKTPLPILLELLDAPRLKTRVAAAVLLARSGAADTKLRHALEWMIHLEDAELRGAVLDALALTIARDPDALPLIVPLLGDPERGRRLEAVRLAQRLKDKARPVEPFLLERLDDPQPEVRFQTLVALEGLRSDPRKCVHAFADLLGDPALAPRVAQQFGALSDASTWVDALVLLACDDPRGVVRYNAMQLALLRGAGSKELIARLGAFALADRDKKVSFAALEALMGMGRPALPQIVNCLRAEDKRVRDRAVYVYKQAWADKEETAKLFAGLLDDKLPHARRNAAWALAQMGADARSVLPVLRAHLKHDDEEVRRYVRQAVAAIDAGK
jgi:HEAT repeat protein